MIRQTYCSNALQLISWGGGDQQNALRVRQTELTLMCTLHYLCALCTTPLPYENSYGRTFACEEHRETKYQSTTQWWFQQPADRKWPDNNSFYQLSMHLYTTAAPVTANILVRNVPPPLWWVRLSLHGDMGRGPTCIARLYLKPRPRLHARPKCRII